jgi:hypothetical protein
MYYLKGREGEASGDTVIHLDLSAVRLAALEF